MKQRLVGITTMLLALGVATAQAQERTIRGTVIDSVNAAPIAGASVAVQGTDLGALTDSDGSFVIRGAPSGQLTMRVQRIGFVPTTVTVPAGESEVTVRLRTSYLQVEELVVTGQATETRRQNAATSVSSVSGEEVTQTSQQTVDKALQGRVAGALISQNSGAPGGGVQIQVRGPGSVFARSAPLYVIDGVLVSDDAIAPNANAITQAATGSNPSLDQDNQQNRIADLNPEDIESIEVMKGPAAAAIYGSLASNGVIIIETKRGSGAPEWRITGRGGIADNSNKLGFRVFETFDEAAGTFLTEESSPQDTADLSAVYGDGQHFDNEQFLADRNDASWEVSASLSGGTDTGLSYFGSAFAKDEAGIIANTGFEKQSLRANLTQDFDRATVNLNTNLIRTQARRGLTNNDNAQTSYYMVLTATPAFLDLRQNSDGSWPFNPFAGGGSNPLQTAALMEKDEEVFRLIGSSNVDFSLVENESSSVRLVFSGGVDWFGQKNDIFSPPTLFFEDNDGLLGTKVVNNADNLQYNTNTNLVWDWEIFEGSTLTTSGGFQYAYAKFENENIVGQNLTGGKDKVDAATVVGIRQTEQKTEDFGFYVQEQLLTLDDRLQITGGVRFDQSSANADNEELFIFPNANVSLRFPDLGGGFADELKVRAAFGQTGNRPLFGQEFTSLGLTENVEGLPGFTIQGDVASPDLKPERQTEIEGGFDLTMFEGRARFEATAYYQKITDLILQRTLAPSSGFNTLFFNGGELKNTGVELALDASVVQTADFGWNQRVNFSMNSNEVTELPVTPFTQGGFGETLGSFCVAEGSSLNDIVGTTTREDLRGQCDLAKLGQATPDFNMNLSQDLRWKGLRLYHLWDWRPGFEVINLTELLADLGGVSPDLEDSDGTITPVHDCFPDCSGQERIAGFIAGNARGYTQPAGFLKLREASLSWELPESAVSSLWSGFESVRLTFSGRNLITVTDYRGLDPEVSNFGRENFARNVDVAPYPPSRSFWLSTELTF